HSEDGNSHGATINTPTDNLPALLACCDLGVPLVMNTTKVFLVFWSPNGTISPSYKGLLQRFVQDLGGTPFLNIVTQYYDQPNGHIKNVVTYGGSYTDTTAYPHTGAAPPATWDPLQDGDIQDEVDRAIAANGWPTGLGNFYAVFTEKGINSCNGSDCTSDDP